MTFIHLLRGAFAAAFRSTSVICSHSGVAKRCPLPKMSAGPALAAPRSRSASWRRRSPRRSRFEHQVGELAPAIAAPDRPSAGGRPARGGEGTTAVANGVQTSVHTTHGRTIYRFAQREPMATELAQVAVGAFTVIERGRHNGVILRDVVPTRLVADLEPKLAAVSDQLDFMEDLVGDYPFPIYGSFVVDAPLHFALESQTLTVYDGGFFADPPASFG